jgi:hypothetical protein
MPTRLSTKLCKSEEKILSKWDEAIAEAKRRIAILKKSIRSFEYFRDSGVPFPEPSPETFEASDELLGQEGDLRQSPALWASFSVFIIHTPDAFSVIISTPCERAEARRFERPR